MTLRWTLSGEGENYTFPLNPKAMTPLFPQRAVTARATTSGRAVLLEGALQPVSWEFQGDILDKDHHEALRHWVYDIKQRCILTDHFGREISLVFTAFQPTPKRSVGRYWRHEYRVTALVLSVGDPTVGPSGA